uniref:phenylalanine--tRNA ligase n=1 Tax=Ceramothamnion japonicum TaxID=218448 RepID=A0A1C9CDE5_CERJP|nr:phenylalanyl-tRNA synthetase beta chain [Ceramium japonicum]AOM66421.1 phenylalanyl-tRNA synthetase beta chain [Ceramium japonicum]
MKFSWRSLNYFLDLNDININQLTHILTIKGFEIDTIDYNKDLNDYILDITITANRQDVLSVFGLANELSYILNKKLINQHKIQQYDTYDNSIFHELALKYLCQIRINKIINIQINISPQWLINYLKAHDIKSTNLIIDIQQYIAIKWGHKIHFFDITTIQDLHINNLSNSIKINKKLNYEELQYNKHLLIQINNNDTQINNQFECNNNSKNIIALSYIYSHDYCQDIKNIYNTIDNMQGYKEAIQLIATFSNAYISKSYLYKTKIYKKKYLLNIQKNLIQYTLGPIITKKSKYLTKETIYTILKQLQLEPHYNYYNKNFKIKIPNYRLNDLYRKIDIIEEIGRIYGYHNFIDKLPNINKKGSASKKYTTIKYIRKYFRDLGIHEVINLSLKKSHFKKIKPLITTNLDSTINLYNPLLEEQSCLRDNLLDNLIQNKIYNYKQKNENTEFFEIGKIFKQDIQTHKKIEEIHIAGIFANTQFIQTSWDTKPHQLNWFHAKGTIEQFFEKMQLKITFDPIINHNEKIKKELSINNFDINKTLYIINALNNKIIGLIGQINSNLYKNIACNQIINIFEFNLNELINDYNQKSHLSYIFYKYSIYPSVTRDLSIKVNKHYSILKIKKFIYELNKQLIHKVEVFNQYKDITNINNKCIGIRITYNGNSKTLNQNDLQLIDKDINTILDNYK